MFPFPWYSGQVGNVPVNKVNEHSNPGSEAKVTPAIEGKKNYYKDEETSAAPHISTEALLRAIS